MTISYTLDLSKTLTENVGAIFDLAQKEMEIFLKQDSEFGRPHIQQLLEINFNDWWLLVFTRNTFDVSGEDLIMKSYPRLKLKLVGRYDPEKFKADKATWENHPSHRQAEEIHKSFYRYKLQRELGIPIPPNGLPPDPFSKQGQQNETIPRKYWWPFSRLFMGRGHN